MTNRRRALGTWLGAVVAVATLAIAAPGIASAGTADDPQMATKLELTTLDRNSAGLRVSPCCISPDWDAVVFNGDTPMQRFLDGTERGYTPSGDFVYLDNLTRGTRYDISVRYTDEETGELIGTTNTVSFTTEPSTDTEPPTTPTNLRFARGPEPQLPNHYDLLWNASTDNADPDIQYVVKRNGSLTGPTTEAFPGDVFTVTAIDTSNNASQPAEITFTGELEG